MLKYVIFLVKEEKKSYILIDIWSPKFTLILVASGVISAFYPLRCCRATSHSFFRPIFALKKSYEHVSQCLNFLCHLIAFRHLSQITCTWLKGRIMEKAMISKILTLFFFFKCLIQIAPLLEYLRVSGVVSCKLFS